MSTLSPTTELEQRGDAFGRELASALVLAGERSGGDGRLMREMAGVAVGEVRKSVRYLADQGLPDSLVLEYEHACRTGFEAEFSVSMRALVVAPEDVRHAA